MFGVPEVDLMATASSTQLPRFFSAVQDRRAAAIDSFTEDWNKFSLAYIFPPPQMMELVLNRIYQCNKSTKFIVISPWKKALPWFQKALSLAMCLPIRLPVQKRTVQDLEVPMTPPENKSGSLIRFVAWKLSGGGKARDGKIVQWGCPDFTQELGGRN